MKVFFVLATLVVAAQMAEIPFTDTSASDNHYKSHSASVSEARRVAAERLQQYADSARNSHYSSSDDNDLQQNVAVNAPLCTVHCGANGASVSQYASNSDVEQIDQQSTNNANYGYVGFNDQSEQTEFNTQQLLQPVSGIVATEAVGANEQHTSQHSEHLTESSSTTGHVAPVAPILYVAPTVASTVYSQQQQQQRYNNEQYTSGVQQRPIAVHVQPNYGGSSSSSDRYTATSANQVSHTTADAITPVAIVATYPVTYPAERQTVRTQRITEHKQTTQAAAPAPQTIITVHHPVQPAQHNTERYTSVYNQQQQYRNADQQRPVYTPVYPTYGVAGRQQSSRLVSSQDRYLESQQLQQPQPIAYTVPLVAPLRQQSTQSSSSHYDNQHTSTTHQQQPQAAIITFPTSLGYVDNTASSSSSHLTNSAVNVNRGAGLAYGPQQRRGSQRVGSLTLHGNHASTNLHSLMSESERLAQEQAQLSGNRYGSSLVTDTGFENFNTQQHFGVGGGASASLFDGSSNQLALNGGGSYNGAGRNGGYIRTKQWENNEKWSSGTQYDENGKQRTYSTLSTAESELHNVNGKSAGYKAATTTLENDGHVSTYSLHT